jgi:hypothetical protein
MAATESKAAAVPLPGGSLAGSGPCRRCAEWFRAPPEPGILNQEAVQEERVTVKLVENFARYLKKSCTDPSLRFKGRR